MFLETVELDFDTKERARQHAKNRGYYDDYHIQFENVEGSVFGKVEQKGISGYYVEMHKDMLNFVPFLTTKDCLVSEDEMFEELKTDDIEFNLID